MLKIIRSRIGMITKCTDPFGRARIFLVAEISVPTDTSGTQYKSSREIRAQL